MVRISLAVSPDVPLGGIRSGHMGFRSFFAVVPGLRQSEADLALAQRGSRWDRSLSLSVEICWSVVAGGGVLLKLWLGFVDLWWVLQWVKMWLLVGVLL